VLGSSGSASITMSTVAEVSVTFPFVFLSFFLPYLASAEGGSSSTSTLLGETTIQDSSVLVVSSAVAVVVVMAGEARRATRVTGKVMENFMVLVRKVWLVVWLEVV
jgi:hypothetical protein